MKISQSAALAPHLLDQATQLGRRLARLRLARGIKQTDAALRAGLSRNTAYRIERGDPGLAIGQVLRYLDAIAPGSTLRGSTRPRDRRPHSSEPAPMPTENRASSSVTARSSPPR